MAKRSRSRRAGKGNKTILIAAAGAAVLGGLYLITKTVSAATPPLPGTSTMFPLVADSASPSGYDIENGNGIQSIITNQPGLFVAIVMSYSTLASVPAGWTAVNNGSAGTNSAGDLLYQWTFTYA